MRRQPNNTCIPRAGVDLNTVAARKTCGCWCGPQYTDGEKDLLTKKRTWTVRNSAQRITHLQLLPLPTLFCGAIVAVPLRSSANKGLCQQRGGEDWTTRELQVEWTSLTMAPERRRNTNSLSSNQQTRRMTRTFFTNVQS